MYSLSLSVATPSAVVYFEYTTTRVSSDHTSHTFCSFCFCVFETVPILLFVVGWSFLFFVAPSLAVFSRASAFNQDVSKWNTGAVTTMRSSKCTLSLPLCVATPFDVMFFEYTTTPSFIGSQVSHGLLSIFLKCFWTAGSNGPCVAANGNRCLPTVD